MLWTKYLCDESLLRKSVKFGFTFSEVQGYNGPIKTKIKFAAEILVQAPDAKHSK